MSTIKLAHIHRFPLKGFAPQSLQSTQLTAGQGLPFDRAWGLTNTERAIAPHGGWTACQAFVRLTKNLNLPLFDVQFDDATLQLQIRAADGRRISVDLNDAASIAQANTMLAQWFPAKIPQPDASPQLVAASSTTGYWDHEDATLSIIALPTVAQLSEAAGIDLDPLRFRGNLLIDGGSAWQELMWPGHRLRLSDTDLEILRPIDRCVATSVNPRTAEKDINIPALLARHAGHVFCGVYARVVQGGELRVGDALELLAPSKSLLQRASRPTTAPPADQWPRAGQITDVIQESASVRSFWISDPLLIDCVQVPLKPGQHLRLHGLGADAKHWRNYTVSALPDARRWRISVKGVARGGMSSWLHAHLKPGTSLLFSGPHGAFHLPQQLERPLIFLSAGIGITPMRAMFEDWMQRADRKPSASVLWIHSARHRAELALWNEAIAIAMASTSDCAQAQLRLHLTEESASNSAQTELDFQSVMLDWLAVCQQAKAQHADVYLCGPPGFMAAGLSALQQAGVAADRIHFERFASPSVQATAQKQPKLPGPFAVRFARSCVQAQWAAQEGSLLELAEQHGLNLPANCRGGACGACVQTLALGQVMHLIEPMSGLAEQQVLMCCAVPQSDVVFDI